MVMLKVENLHFGYEGGPEVLRGVDLEVSRGSCVCLMGVNGCGKSTLLDCVLGERRPQSGRVEVGGHEATKLTARDRALLVSYVPQTHERTFPYEVRHLVMMGRTAHLGTIGLSGDDDEARVMKALASCGIEHLAHRPCTDLSGGEMQMVLLARALVQDASLVLMDEPTAHLDFRNEILFLETVERLIRDAGTTMLMATHAPNHGFHLEGAGVPVQVAVMDGGRVCALGEPSRVLTEELLQDVFGVRAQVWTQAGEAGQVRCGCPHADGIRRQVVPVATTRRNVDAK